MLSSKQTDVAALLLRAYTNRQLAETLSMALETVKFTSVALPNPAAVPLPGLPAAWTPRERQEWIDRARAAQPIVQANFRARLQALRARKNLPEDRLPMAPALNGLN